jgi:hypothetical protein
MGGGRQCLRLHDGDPAPVVRKIVNAMDTGPPAEVFATRSLWAFFISFSWLKILRGSPLSSCKSHKLCTNAPCFSGFILKPNCPPPPQIFFITAGMFIRQEVCHLHQMTLFQQIRIWMCSTCLPSTSRIDLEGHLRIQQTVTKHPQCRAT